MKWSVIALPIVVVIEIIVLMNFHEWNQKSINDLEQRHYDIAVNYAIDAAAMIATVESSDVSLDYVELQNIKIDPTIALRTYVEMMLRNKGWAADDKNYNEFLNEYIPFFCVVGYDGYYIWSPVENRETVTLPSGQNVTMLSYKGEWSPKLPYSRETDTHVYLYTLGNTYYSTYEKATAIFKHNVRYVDDDTQNPGTLNDRTKTVSMALNHVINDRLSEALEYKFNGIWSTPVSATVKGTQVIDSPAILTMFCDKNTSIEENVIYAVAGTMYESPEVYIAYMRDGVPVYTNSTNRDEVEALGLVVKGEFSSKEKAASAGYYFDTKIGGN